MSNIGWQDAALCRAYPLGYFFPEDQRTRRARRLQEGAAKQVCARCPVVDSCRDHALSMGERYGVWGALAGRERVGSRRKSG